MNYELLLESLLYFSPKFREMLYSIDSEIAKDLLSLEGTNIKSDISFIDITKDGVVSFTQMKNAIKKINKIYGYKSDIDTSYSGVDNDAFYVSDGVNDGPGVYNKSRNEIKLGKLINNVFPNKYKDSDIENFVNLIKAFLKKSEYEFEVVIGKDIEEGYKEENYLKKIGTLANSCMTNKKNLLKLYTKNPDVCKLVILRKGGKIAGRALLWKIHKFKLDPLQDNPNIDFKYFLDRIYTCDDYLIKVFRDYANENGWATRYQVGMSINNKDIRLNNNVIYNVDMEIKVKEGDYGKYPYMDTFARLNIYSGILFNDGHPYEIGHILRGLNGEYWSKNYPKKKSLITRFKNFFT